MHRGVTNFSAAIIADVCPVAAFGPSKQKKFGNPLITEQLYATGPGYSDQCSLTVWPFCPTTSISSRKLLVSKPVARTMMSASTKPSEVSRPSAVMEWILESVRVRLGEWRDSR